MQPGDVHKVGIIGAGIMGSGITEVVSRTGVDTVFVETDDERVARGRAAIERSMGRAVERGKLGAEERDETLDRIAGTTDLDEVSDADLVIEAATEDMETKLGLFRRLDELTRPDVVLASNTSSLPIIDLAMVTKRPERVVGMHFFNPPPIMRLLELVPSIRTAPDTMEFARAFGEHLGKVTVVSKDRAGFIVNFLLQPYLNSAIEMLDEGFATRDDIDNAVKLGLGHPMGPFELLDLIGLDTADYISNVLFDEFKDPLYASPTLLKRMISAGYLGRKSGKGFYEHEG
ncbi:MAG: 3-hydroxybutyryl-CoA dehydrogenase [Actinomycetota bacterium]|nr:3-hydroxybutyryl-CoA dehydrogenase [Actinomycetota bacterium]